VTVVSTLRRDIFRLRSRISDWPVPNAQSGPGWAKSR